MPIDFTLHRETVRAFAKDHLEADESRELNDMLDQMEQRVKDDAAGCPLCKDLMLQLSAVGVISRKPDATEEEKKINSEKTRIKEKIRRELKVHLADSEYKQLHEGLEEPDWWNRWVQRSQFFIQPEYVRRNQLLQQREEMFRDRMPYHLHPVKLCSGKDEPAIFDTSERVDCQWAARHKPPAPGDIVVVRSQEPNEAFMVGKIVKLLPNEESEAVRRKVHERHQRIIEQFCGFDENITRARARPLHPRNVELHPHDEALLHYMSKTKPGVQGELQAGDSRLHWRTEHRCFEVRPSRAAMSPLGQPCSLGLFATRDIAEGEPIEWYSHCLRHADELGKPGAPKTTTFQMDLFLFSSQKTNNSFDLRLNQQIQTVCLNMHNSNPTLKIKPQSNGTYLK